MGDRVRDDDPVIAPAAVQTCRSRRAAVSQSLRGSPDGAAAVRGGLAVASRFRKREDLPSALIAAGSRIREATAGGRGRHAVHAADCLRRRRSLASGACPRPQRLLPTRRRRWSCAASACAAASRGSCATSTGRVPAGACAAILGPNGSGKSTLTRILACHLWPTDGECVGPRPTLRRREPAGRAQADPPRAAGRAVRRRPELSDARGRADGLLRHHRPVRRRRPTRCEPRPTDCSRRSGCRTSPTTPYATLSSGERVRSLIARRWRPAGTAAARRADGRPGPARPRAGAGDGAAAVRARVGKQRRRRRRRS